MAEILTCSKCLKSLQIPEQYCGETVQCPQCGHKFVATSTSVSAAPVPKTQPGAAGGDANRTKKRWEDQDEDFYPRRRRGRNDDDDDDLDDFERPLRRRHTLPPNRGGLIMALGLVSLIGGWLFCLPIVVGPAAWYMAQMDLRAIRDGYMDSTGESMVRTGQVCGIISTVILIVGVAAIGIIFLVNT